MARAESAFIWEPQKNPRVARETPEKIILEIEYFGGRETQQSNGTEELAFYERRRCASVFWR